MTFTLTVKDSEGCETNFNIVFQNKQAGEWGKVERDVQ